MSIDWSNINNLLYFSLLRMMESGLANRELHIWYHKKPKCNSDLILSPVSLGPTSSAFLILIMGGLVSILMMMFEFCRYKYHTFCRKI